MTVFETLALFMGLVVIYSILDDRLSDRRTKRDGTEILPGRDESAPATGEAASREGDQPSATQDGGNARSTDPKTKHRGDNGRLIPARLSYAMLGAALVCSLLFLWGKQSDAVDAVLKRSMPEVALKVIAWDADFREREIIENEELRPVFALGIVSCLEADTVRGRFDTLVEAVPGTAARSFVAKAFSFERDGPLLPMARPPLGFIVGADGSRESARVGWQDTLVQRGDRTGFQRSIIFERPVTHRAEIIRFVERLRRDRFICAHMYDPENRSGVDSLISVLLLPQRPQVTYRVHYVRDSLAMEEIRPQVVPISELLEATWARVPVTELLASGTSHQSHADGFAVVRRAGKILSPEGILCVLAQDHASMHQPVWRRIWERFSRAFAS